MKKRRFLFDALAAHLESEKFTIIVGARQTGKSTLLTQFREYCDGLGYTTFFFNLEHKDIYASLDASPENIFLYMPRVSGKIYVFIDEIQKLSDPSNFLKVLWDDHRDRIKVIATGSSAFYIDKKFNDSLAGRKKIFNLYTCTFEEALYLRGETELLQEYRRIRMDNYAKSLMLPQIQAAFYEYMRFGGYPEVLMTEDESEKIDILKDLRDSFVKKDIDDANINDEDAFFRLMKMLAAQAGGLVNVNELCKMVRIKEETVVKYMNVMTKSFHIRLIKPFFKNLDKELVKMPMVYFMDSGMRNVLVNNFLPIIDNPAKGQIWENQVFRILADKHDVDELRFWRTTDKKEVDFILPSSVPPQAIEVKSDDSKAKASSYKTFTKAYPEFNLEFYCLEPFNEELMRRL